MAGFRYSFKAGEFASALFQKSELIAAAATGAVTEAGTIAKNRGRADIASAGFSKGWQNALRLEIYPKQKNSSKSRNSINAAAHIFHRVGYAGVFESGDTISGKPLLWLPLKSTPQRIGRSKMTPAAYVKSIGPLVTIQRPGQAPLLAGQIAINRRGQTTPGKVTLSALRRGNSGKASKLVPLFVGIPKAKMPDKFSIREITVNAASQLGSLYMKHLKVD
ncbi:MAG: hypothetical protein BGO03_01810 [Mesorhizobium sp. 61-13]|nr:hypothetical protein [Mesorhizobium sp.]OJU51144.1 MAG: hypothetical protein BGO03_01810 [Mesorhizobium sp. 61-13]